MANSFNLTVCDDANRYSVELVEISKETKAPNTIAFHGKHYEIRAQDSEMPQVLQILDTLYPDSVKSSISLSGRVPAKEARMESLVGVDQAAGFQKKPPIQSKWKVEDKTYLLQFKRLFAEKFLEKQDAKKEELKSFLQTETLQKPMQEDFEEKLQQALETKNVDLLAQLLTHFSEVEMMMLNKAWQLDIPTRHQIPPNCFIFSREAREELERHMKDPEIDFSGDIALMDANGIYTCSSQEEEKLCPFAIHSVGKMFTGVLALKLIQEGIVSKKILHTPIHLLLSTEVMEALPESVQEHLREAKPTLHQVMMHKGGLGNYLPKYEGAIACAILAGEKPPLVNKPEDLLPYAGEDIYPLEEEHYSNLGFLLIGLALQNCTGVSFDQLLNEHIIRPAGMERFSSSRPQDGRYNPQDAVARYLCGSPAGGYWTTVKDLCVFGRWVAKQHENPFFQELVKEYGGKFYSEGVFLHAGGIPSSSAHLRIIPGDNIVMAIVSDKDKSSAIKMDMDIMTHMLRRSS